MPHNIKNDRAARNRADEKSMNDTNGVALVLAFTDVDDDNRQDFYIGNDGTPAELLARYGRDTLEEVFLDVARGRSHIREAAQ